MVSLKAFVALVAVNAVSVMASPAPVPVPAAEAAPAPAAVLAQASIYFCEHTYWNGACRNQLVTLDSCANVPSGWNDRISSIRNDSKTYYKCLWYLDANCKGGSYDNQEDANLADGNGRFNDSISSYSCKAK
ncbi:hypothetical protein AJ80_00246 [Polytolypa hystricis UAMH7299]|uniref:Cyanovirin-N domain-containing protein n=1 Tax=Polytolypa hystricis (strain UAMH7299) TaxID=1447883 RepID=A0A2B7Z3Q4_POLH7|nr:hypothetical protein AJ80_00246 [Polytolypa hystricis UAMH7299]